MISCSHNGVPKQLAPASLNQPGADPQLRRMFLLSAAIIMGLVMLACGFIETNSQSVADSAFITDHLPTLTRTRLPTLTPTADLTQPAMVEATEPIGVASAVPDGDTSVVASSPEPTAILSTESGQTAGITDTSAGHLPSSPADTADTGSSSAPVNPPAEVAADLPTPTSSPTATATATEVPSPTSTPTAAPPTSTPLPEGWVFANMRTSTDHDRGILLLYGDLINNTGLTQDLALLTGVFYDDQGQMMPDRPKFVSWPIEIVPQGGRVPFELTVIDMERANNFDLKVEARPSDDILREDFEFLDTNPSAETGSYCVIGRLRNPGNPLQDHLKVVAVLYDDQDKVLNFNDYYKYYPQEVVGDQTMDFEVCVDPLNQEVARYELRAWGL